MEELTVIALGVLTSFVLFGIYRKCCASSGSLAVLKSSHKVVDHDEENQSLAGQQLEMIPDSVRDENHEPLSHSEKTSFVSAEKHFRIHLPKSPGKTVAPIADPMLNAPSSELEDEIHTFLEKDPNIEGEIGGGPEKEEFTFEENETAVREHMKDNAALLTMIEETVAGVNDHLAEAVQESQEPAPAFIAVVEEALVKKEEVNPLEIEAVHPVVEVEAVHPVVEVETVHPVVEVETVDAGKEEPLLLLESEDIKPVVATHEVNTVDLVEEEEVATTTTATTASSSSKKKKKKTTKQ